MHCVYSFSIFPGKKPLQDRIGWPEAESRSTQPKDFFRDAMKWREEVNILLREKRVG